MHTMQVGGCITLLLVLVGCQHLGPSEPLSPVGITATPDGNAVEVLFIACPGEVVRQLRLVPLGASGDVVSDNQSVLWQLDAVGQPTNRKFIVNADIPGYRQTVSFHGQISEDHRQMVFLVETSARSVQSATFVPAGLKPNVVEEGKVGGVALDEFQRRTGKDTGCD